MTLISIIIPTVPTDLNILLLKKAVNSLIQNKSAEYEYEIIIVANNWEGFSGPCNKGIKQAKGDFILIMNDDVEIVEPGWEKIMTEPFNNPQVGIVGHYHTKQHGKYSALWFTMIRPSLFAEIGYLDEDLSLFSQDIAFGYLAAQKGFSTVFVAPHVVHKWSQTTNRLDDQEAIKVEAKVIFKEKYGIEHDTA